MQSEIIFVVKEDSKGGYIARALGESILTEADNLPALRENVKEAVTVHFQKFEQPSTIRLHFVRDELIKV